MAMKLTEAAVKRASVPREGAQRAMLWDNQVIGFGCAILPTGTKVFWFQYRPRPGGRNTSSRMVRIGPWPSVSLTKARNIAQKLAGQVADGKDPAAERQAERLRDKATLRVLLAEGGPYQRVLEHRGTVNAGMAMSSLRRGLARLMNKEVARLTRADFVNAIAAIEDEGKPGAALDLRKFARGFLEWCVGRGFITFNPLAGLPRKMRTRAERLAAAANGGRALNDDEIHKVWQAAGDDAFGSFGGLVRLALLSALRRGELAQIERNGIIADRIVVRPEHAKTGARHEVPLTDLMRQVIAAQPLTTSPLLFPSPVTGRRITGWTERVANLRKASGVNFRLHDLRRTARTLMSRLGVTEDIAELAIGHLRADLIARYNKDEAWEGRSDAFERVSAHVETLIGARPGAAVIPLRG